TWCDTAYAFEEGTRRDEEDVLGEIARHPARLVQVTGGEPLAQPAAFDFVGRLCDEGYEVVIETSGHVALDRLDRRAVVVMDLKAPGSGEGHRNRWENLDVLKPGDEIKVVVSDRPDYEWARDVVRGRGLAARWTVLLSPVHGALDPGRLARWILEDGLPVRIQVQLHKYLWPGVERGV
ncbi:MAG TPA: 7-carboxy-7-deazaguanine synthase, partial [Vicinamibacteria bacterium]|nr:7-carboxy-7-deazaguanine synthase [Vicinamibacteria bacterium]